MQRSSASSVMSSHPASLAGQADADVVVQDVDAAPARVRVSPTIALISASFGDVGLETPAAVPPLAAIMPTVSSAEPRL